MKKLFFFVAICMASFAGMSSSASAFWAIAYSQGSDGAWSEGSAWGGSTPSDAANLALSNCRRDQASRGTDGTCTIVGRGNGGCAALAVAQGGNGWGTASGDLDQGYSAIAYCRRNNPGGCDVKSNFCDRNLGGRDPQAATFNNNVPSPGNNAPSFSAPSFNVPSYSPPASTSQPRQTYVPMPPPSSYRTPVNPCKGPGACAVQ